MSAEYRIELPSPWQEAVQFIAERNEWPCTGVIHLGVAIGILLLSGLTECPETLLKEDFPPEVVKHLTQEIWDRAWERIEVAYDVAGKEGMIG